MLRPDLPVLELLNAVHEHYAAHDLLDDLYWSGGYELGIAFPRTGSDLSLTTSRILRRVIVSGR